jgi:hypothetical protein
VENPLALKHCESNEIFKNKLDNTIKSDSNPNESYNTINHLSNNNNTPINQSDNTINQSTDNNNQSNDTESIQSDSTINCSHPTKTHKHVDSGLFTNPEGYKYTRINKTTFKYVPISELNSDSSSSNINANNYSNIFDPLNDTNNSNLDDILQLNNTNNSNINDPLNNTNNSNKIDPLKSRDANNHNNKELRGLRRSVSLGGLPEVPKTETVTPTENSRFKKLRKIWSSLNLRKK